MGAAEPQCTMEAASQLFLGGNSPQGVAADTDVSHGVGNGGSTFVCRLPRYKDAGSPRRVLSLRSLSP